MKVGDLVKHKSTGAIGLLLRHSRYKLDGWFNVQWYDEYTSWPTSHLIGELELINASR